MSVQTVVLALFSVFLSTAGQLLLKSGMARVGYIGGERLGKPLALVLQMIGTWQIILGLGLFFISAGFWLLVLSRIPLNLAYPFAGLTYLLIALFGKFVLKEQVPGIRWLGVAMIIAGILVVGKSAPSEVPGEVATVPEVSISG